MTAPRLSVLSAEAFERDLTLRIPFRFGVITLRQATQVFLRVQVRDEATGDVAEGHAAELMVPKWFDKSPDLSEVDNVNQLRRSVQMAMTLSTAGGNSGARAPAGTAADLAWQLDAEQRNALSEENGLVAGFAPALMARTVIDALCRHEQISFYAAMQRNRVGLGARHLPADLEGFDVDAFLASLSPSSAIALRHTIGMADPITPADVTEPAPDALPHSLTAVIAHYQPTYFKIKVSGDVDADLARLSAIAEALDTGPDYRVTLDGNEQFSTPEHFTALLDALDSKPELNRLRQAMLFVEQPLPRHRTFQYNVHALARRIPLLIDESDSDLDSFRQARDCGYRGVSSKNCKGLYRSLINLARTRHWSGDGYFLSAEDLTTQPGLSVQQDLALVSLLGLRHVERNGHHYVDGMVNAPAAEQQAFAAAHPGLYRLDETGLHLRIEGGQIALDSLSSIGFTSSAIPDYRSMRALAALNFPPNLPPTL